MLGSEVIENNRGAAGQSDGLVCGLDVKLPARLAVGKGTVLYLSGWCFHPAQIIDRLEVIIDGARHAVSAHSMPRDEKPSAGNPLGHGRRSGFWALIPIAERQTATLADVELSARLRNGATARARLAGLKLHPRLADESRIQVGQFGPVGQPAPADGPLVAICLATHNPPLALFRRQVESIAGQSYRNWICIVSDDASRPESLAEIEKTIQGDGRFVLSPSSQWLGFYHNFERCLSLAPSEAEFIALSDQDDYWHADKLGELLSRFDERTTLVYSDMRIVNEQGEVTADSCWTARRNNYSNLASMMLANSVTGAAAMFRRELLDLLLPFPPRVGDLYHDHWLGSLALAVGRIKYVDRPLQDYTQHGGNVIGHDATPRPDLPRLVYYSFREMFSPEGRMRARAVYFEKVLKLEAMAQVLLMRGGGRIGRREQRTLRRLSGIEDSWLGCVWLALRGLKGWGRKSATIGAEYFLLPGLAWRFFAGREVRKEEHFPSVI